MAAGADVIVAALGESSEMSGGELQPHRPRPSRRATLLLEALLNTGKPVVLALFTGRPLTLTLGAGACSAILNVVGGSEAAYAIGDVLFGDANPVES